VQEEAAGKSMTKRKIEENTRRTKLFVGVSKEEKALPAKLMLITRSRRGGRCAAN
jgi:hypothetical protein